MHPNTFLRTFWTAAFRPEVFIAMPLTDAFRKRFDTVIEPAVKRLSYGGTQMRARRVDLDKTGDSILTDIMEGVAHSAMIFADVSTIGHDSKTGKPYRNANVMYEVGLALSSRQPSEVLLVRDDHDPFLFDVSTVPHMQMDFTDVPKATDTLAAELQARLNEVKNVQDARVRMAAASLTSDERLALAVFANYDLAQSFWFKKSTRLEHFAMARLLDKQLVRTAGVTSDGHAMYRWTLIGKALARDIHSHLPVHQVGVPSATEASPAPPALDAPSEPDPSSAA